MQEKRNEELATAEAQFRNLMVDEKIALGLLEAQKCYAQKQSEIDKADPKRTPTSISSNSMLAQLIKDNQLILKKLFLTKQKSTTHQKMERYYILFK